MKILILLSTIFFSLTSMATDTTEAGVFGPTKCDACAKMQQNSARLGNNHGVLNSKKKPKKPATDPTTQAVDVGH